MRLNNYRVFIKALLFICVASCGKTTQTNTPQKAWDYDNAPERLGLKSHNYVTDFTLLKKRAKLRKKPWSGDYWASYLGGISYRWNHPQIEEEYRVFYPLKPMSEITTEEIPILSPSEKMDLIKNDANYSFTKEERERTEVMDRRFGHKIPEWYGLCHAWAPATILYKNPSPIIYKREDGLEIPLGSSDIKAMLIYFIDKTYSKSYFVSNRCNVDAAKLKRKVEKGYISLKQYNDIMESANCEGVNPGAFHIILANMIGLRNQSFIADVTRDAEVWNQAIYSYRSRVLQTRLENFSYKADPHTVKEIKVRTIMAHMSEIESTWHKDTTSDSLELVTYEYWLELDQNNKIIGGTWISDDRPDFLWRQLKPHFNQKYNFIKNIYHQSTNHSPLEPISSHHNRSSSSNENNEDLDENIEVSLTSHKRIPSLFGERLEITGSSSAKTLQLKVEYYSEKSALIKTRWIHIRPDQTFETATFIWTHDGKVKQVKIIAVNSKGQPYFEKILELS